MNKQVLATVNGFEITKEDLDLLLQHAPAEQKMQLNTLGGKKYVLNEMITQQMLYLDAKEKGLDKHEDYLRELKILGENLLKQYAVNKILETVVVDDAEAKEYYEKNPEQFVKGPCAHAKHILVKEEEQAQKIFKEIQEGKKFEDAASEYSECPSKANGGDLGEFEKGKMVPEFEKVAFELEIGKVSEPVKTQFGYHLILVEDRKDKKEVPFEEVKNTIKDYMLKMKQNDTYKAYADGLRDKYEITTNEDLLK